MFREMRRSKQALTQEECVDVLKEAQRGVLSVTGDGGYPYGVPVNFCYNAETGTIWLHGAREGHRYDAVKSDGRVCFTTWMDSHKEEGAWAWYVKSVIVFGRAELIADPEPYRDVLTELGMKYYPTREETEAEIARDMKRVQLTAIHIEHMSGKLVHEK